MDAATGKVQVHGVAMGGTTVSTGSTSPPTGGRARAEAGQIVGPDIRPYAWRPFVLIADFPRHPVLVSRATNAAGVTQPENFPPNERGYGDNGWRAHAVDVTVR